MIITPSTIGPLPVGTFGAAGQLPMGGRLLSARSSSDCRPRDQRNTPTECSINRASYECVALRWPYQKSGPTTAPACGRHVCLQLSLLLQGALFKNVSNAGQHNRRSDAYHRTGDAERWGVYK